MCNTDLENVNAESKWRAKIKADQHSETAEGTCKHKVRAERYKH